MIKFDSYKHSDREVSITVAQDGIDIAVYNLTLLDQGNRISIEVQEIIFDQDDPENDGREEYPLSTFRTLRELEELGHESRDRMIATGEHLRDLARENG